MEVDTIIQSENWWVEGDRAYFCAAEYGVLFEVNLENMQSEFLARIPNCDFNKFRLNSYCMKYKCKIYCFPYERKYICCYDLANKAWEIIDIGYENLLTICMSLYKEGNEKVWLAEQKGKNIFLFNLEKGKVESKYTIPLSGYIYNGQYVLLQEKLYYISGNKVYCIDTQEDKIETYDISGIETTLYSICYDGHNFWISGDRKEIYVWNVEQGIVKIIRNLPEERNYFYDNVSMIIPETILFKGSVVLDKYVWFFPLQCNMPIIYIDKETYQVRELEIQEEQETDESLHKRGNALQYIFEYVRQDRYIGIYSIKNNKIFEIDTKMLCVEYRRYFLSENTIKIMANEYYRQKCILCDKYEIERVFFSRLLENGGGEASQIHQNAGSRIYDFLKAEKL